MAFHFLHHGGHIPGRSAVCDQKRRSGQQRAENFPQKIHKKRRRLEVGQVAVLPGQATPHPFPPMGHGSVRKFYPLGNARTAGGVENACQVFGGGRARGRRRRELGGVIQPEGSGQQADGPIGQSAPAQDFQMLGGGNKNGCAGR